MRTDDTLAQLALENPVQEQDLAGPESAEALALRERIVLEDRPGGRPRATPRRRRLALQAALAGAAATAIALAVTGALSGDGGLPGEGPEAASAVERAAAALSGSGDEILHTVERKTLEFADGNSERSYVETWQQLSPPFDQRRNDGPQGREFANVNGRPQIYNPIDNTIATLGRGVELPEGAGSFPLEPLGPPIGRTGKRGGALAPWTGLRDRILPLLRSGELREAGRATIDGREAIRFVSERWGITLAVDARTYEPIEWTLEFEGPPGIETTRLTTFERLPATEANLAELDLRKAHPDAKLDVGGITLDPQPAGKGG
jgi:hypothetical protein